jgi:hypothetical protein
MALLALVNRGQLPDRTLDNFEFAVVPIVSEANVMAICAGDSWIKSWQADPAARCTLAPATGLALVENRWRLLFALTSDLAQKLPVARRGTALHSHHRQPVSPRVPS